MKAILKTYRQSPRKVRLLADLVRGKKIDDAITSLKFADKKSAPIMEKLINSAVSNASNNNSVSRDDLFVKEIRVDKGVTMKRFMPRARGSASRINKRTSHIVVVLGLKEEMKKKNNRKERKAKIIKTNPKAKKVKATS